MIHTLATRAGATLDSTFRTASTSLARSLSSIAVVAGLALLSGAALAQSRAEPQNYPARPIRVIVANTAGSATDVVTRMAYMRSESERWSHVIKAAGLAAAQ